MLHILQNMYTVIDIQICVNMLCIFSIGVRVYVSSSNKTVMMMWSASTYQK